MNGFMSRRGFVVSGSAIAGGLAVGAWPGGSIMALQSGTEGTGAATPASKPAFDKGPALAADLARAAVGESHRNLEKVKELIAAEPELVNACWDWGGGDFETPLGAAAHTGQREIARFLLDNGARLDVFAAAMLGMLDVVKAAFAADPMTRFALGPHGLTLMQHAEAGEEPSSAVVAFLNEVEINDHQRRDLPLSPRALKRYVGQFKVEDATSSPSSVEFIAEGGRIVWIDGATQRPLAHQGNHRFMPMDSQADSPTLTFRTRGGWAQSLSIRVNGTTVNATRGA